MESPLTYHQEIELEIERLTNLGLGVGRHEGFVVMVPGVLAGERVRVRIYKCLSNYAQADLLEVLRPSDQRVAPQCSLFGECGGCQYQMMSYEAQLTWKREHVEDCLRPLKAQGHVLPVVEPTQGSPKTYGYRSKLTPHYQRLKGEEPKIGFLRLGSSRAIVDVPQCPIAHPAINAVLPAARQALIKNPPKRGGTLLLREAGGVVSNPKDYVRQQVGDFVFEHQAGDFFQNNLYILPHLVDFVVQAVKEVNTQTLIDAYCGSGLFAISAAPHVSLCVGIELSEPAVACAQRNAQRNKQEHCQFIVGQAERIFEHVASQGAQCTLIIDPPRKGCDASFLEQLLAFAPKRLIYVSCDPATQARDMAPCLAHGYTLTRIRPFDLFPQTRHVESVAILDRGF